MKYYEDKQGPDSQNILKIKKILNYYFHPTFYLKKKAKYILYSRKKFL